MMLRDALPAPIRKAARALLVARERRRRSVANVARANTREAFETLFGSDDLREEYLGPARLAFYDEIAAIVAELEAASVLDAGCGTGHLLAAVLARSGPFERVAAVDYAAAAIAQVRVTVPSAEGVVADVYELPFPAEAFDLVLCTEVLEHLDRPAVALVELARVCKPRGHLVLSVPDGEVDTYEGHRNYWSAAEFEVLAAHVGDAAVRRTAEGDLVAVVRR